MPQETKRTFHGIKFLKIFKLPRGKYNTPRKNTYGMRTPLGDGQGDGDGEDPHVVGFEHRWLFLVPKTKLILVISRDHEEAHLGHFSCPNESTLWNLESALEKARHWYF